jgi:hypothetical protein
MLGSRALSLRSTKSNIVRLAWQMRRKFQRSLRSLNSDHIAPNLFGVSLLVGLSKQLLILKPPSLRIGGEPFPTHPSCSPLSQEQKPFRFRNLSQNSLQEGTSLDTFSKSQAICGRLRLLAGPIRTHTSESSSLNVGFTALFSSNRFSLGTACKAIS